MSSKKYGESLSLDEAGVRKLRKDIGIRLKEAREKKYATQVEAAEDYGCTQATWGEMENGKRLPRADTLLKLSRFLGVSIEWIVRGEATGIVQKGRAVVDANVSRSMPFKEEPKPLHFVIRLAIDVEVVPGAKTIARVQSVSPDIEVQEARSIKNN